MHRKIIILTAAHLTRVGKLKHFLMRFSKEVLYLRLKQLKHPWFQIRVNSWQRTLNYRQKTTYLRRRNILKNKTNANKNAIKVPLFLIIKKNLEHFIITLVAFYVYLTGFSFESILKWMWLLTHTSDSGFCQRSAKELKHHREVICKNRVHEQGK